uniref:Carbohydrate kinase PfkB domain-containing protein n=1 Tax=Rhodosorus marinus TaxID=101924 RepID=A0A7S3A7J2_9RHOD|mmetsp:Transcript_6237/g.26380  ORF Transcript_6237/g.26380 Transcript_6237/m.26380 type:complete len:251 (+) Transcript_6237:330-1082(+)
MVCFATPGSGLRLRCAKRVAMCSSAGGGQRFDLVTLGNVVVDVLVPMAGFPVVAGGHQDLRGGGVALSPGGASNALIVGSRLGMHTSAVDWLGEDAFGDFLLSKLSSLGVGTDGIERRPGQSLACVILVSESGDHTFIASNEKPTAQFDPHISSDSALKSLPSSFTSTISNANALLVDGYALDDLPFITLLGAVRNQPPTPFPQKPKKQKGATTNDGYFNNRFNSHKSTDVNSGSIHKQQLVPSERPTKT